ncbi:MAG TPA: sugar phosphate isomerase/epimerase [Gemmatimonadaceae bacterium]|nr:sugar phosphate isomerase/epimerase [Gemmatimonadaceae bacterium]
MSPTSPRSPIDRRAFLTRLAGVGGAALASSYVLPAWAESLGDGALTAPWRDQIGLQLFTVRDRFPTDYAGTLQAVATIGYKQVQPTMNYGGRTPADVKAILDGAGLTAPTTHVSPPTGADFERTLEDYAKIGHRYTTVRISTEGRGGGAGGGRPPGAAAGAGGAPRAAGDSAAAAGTPASGPRPQRPPAPPQTLDAVKRTADALNQAGRITQKHGLKVIVHNHTVEFAPLADSSQRPYDVLLAETDPSLVAMELDIGWAAVAGVKALDLFRQAPGRFEVWHVKDITGLAALEGKTQAERQRAAQIVPVGQGEVDYKPIFAQAETAGLKHFYVEQDSAPASGDSLAAAAMSYRALVKVLGA